MHAGEFGQVGSLLAVTETESLDDLRRALADLLRAQSALVSGGAAEAAPLLLSAARRLDLLDVGLARDTYLDAWAAASLAGSLATEGTLLEVSTAALAAPSADAPRPQDLLLSGLAALVVDGLLAAAPTLRHAGEAFAAGDLAPEHRYRWGFLANVAGAALWDDDLWYRTTSQQIQFSRQAGALDRLPIELMTLALQESWRGDFASATVAIAEAHAVAEATGAPLAQYGAMFLASLAGREDEASKLIESTINDAGARGEGTGVQMALWSKAVLCNGLGQYEEALAAARRACEDQGLPYVSAWTLPELVEASVRCDEAPAGARALANVHETTSAASTDWALGIEARCRALLTDGAEAESLYVEAIDRLGRTSIRSALARAHLLFGEWLRRENRRVDARTQLRTAQQMLEAIGMHAFAARARRELLATGERIRKRRDETRTDLTPQEEQIARLARDGRTNVEIGAQLYLSARTVEWHLRKVFPKLGITSRRGLRDALLAQGRSRAPA
jgi:DNA-binding CsgD family transcriptional regulator